MMKKKTKKQETSLTPDVFALIDKIANRYAKRFKFGIFDIEDIYQEAFMMMVEALKKYDGVSPLENFLVIHVKNRLISLKRDNYARASDVCNNCPEFNAECESCQKRRRTYTAKRNLSDPLDISYINSDKERSMMDALDTIEDIENTELIDIINKKLPVQYREDYLKMKEGVYVNKSIREEIEKIITKIINEHTR